MNHSSAFEVDEMMSFLFVILCLYIVAAVVPPFIQFERDGLLTDYVFAFYLQSVAGKHDGQLILGGTDKAHYEGELWYVVGSFLSIGALMVSLPLLLCVGKVYAVDQRDVLDDRH